ncbi:MAG: AraC family transcriptional regulator, partial [Bacteroidota bacterium]
EIVYISKGSKGRRHIGEHISFFTDGDLIFLGPDLPHYGFSNPKDNDHTEIVVQLKEDFLGSCFFDAPELIGVRQLFERAQSGLSFFGEIKEEVGQDLMAMTKMNNFDRLLRLLRVLRKLSQSEEYRLLNARGFALEVDGKDHQRVKSIYEFVEAHYLEVIKLEEVAALVQMTVPSFCRFFKKLTTKTFTHFVNEFRVTHACRLLADSHLSIAEVCFDSGFNNLSHFNKHFKLVTGQSPGQYRKSMKMLLM